MSQKTSIEWADSTWTPIRARLRKDALETAKARGWLDIVARLKATKPNGELRVLPGRLGPHCEKVSPGCASCYSEANNLRCLPANGTGMPFDKRSRELVDIVIDENILTQPLHWKKRSIFVCSQTDLFGEWVPDESIDQVFAVMALCPQHLFLVLTKRAKRMREWYEAGNPAQRVANRAVKMWDTIRPPFDEFFGSWPLPNVYLGVSAEDQPRYDERIEDLVRTPAAKRFISHEPALSAIDYGFLGTVPEDWGLGYRPLGDFIDLSIYGGESGKNARPNDIAWARSMIRQCREAGIAAFCKQLGARPYQMCSSCKQEFPGQCRHFGEPGGHGSDRRVPLFLRDRKGGDMVEWSEDLRVREVPK